MNIGIDQLFINFDFMDIDLLYLLNLRYAAEV